MTEAFDVAWNLLKGKNPIVEFEGNDECPKCGERMKQRQNQLGHGFPVVWGFGCKNCRSFRPHDPEYAKTPLESSLNCGECKGTGDSNEYNARTGDYSCDECDGTGDA